MIQAGHIEQSRIVPLLHQIPRGKDAILIQNIKMIPLGPDPFGIIFEFDGRGEHLGVIQKLAADG